MNSLEVKTLVQTHPSLRRAVVVLAKVLGMAALTAVCSKIQFYLPFSPVPITMQTFAVVLSGALLGSRLGALSQISLIGMGLAGLPVFASPMPGMLVLMGPTGGYIFGFILAAFAAGWLFERTQPTRLLTQFFVFFVATLLIFIPGLFFLSIYTGSSGSQLLWVGLIPFLPGAFVKNIGATIFMKLLGRVKA